MAENTSQYTEEQVRQYKELWKYNIFQSGSQRQLRNSSHKANNIYARADNNNPPGVAHNRNRY
jgi:hypothetical protein